VPLFPEDSDEERERVMAEKRQKEEVVFTIKDLEDLYAQMATQDQTCKDFIEELSEIVQTREH